MPWNPEAMVSIISALAFGFAGLYLFDDYRAHREEQPRLFWGIGLTVAALPHLLATLQFLGLVAQDRYGLLAFLAINHVAMALLLAGTLLLVTGRRAVYLGLPAVYALLWSAITTALTLTSQAPDLAYRLYILNVWGYFNPLILIMVGIFVREAWVKGARGYLIVALGCLIVITGNAFWAPSLTTDYAWLPRLALFVGTAAILIGFTYIGQEAEIRRLLAAAEQRVGRAIQLHLIGQRITAILHVQAIMDAVCDAVVQSLGYRMAWIGLCREGSFDVEPTAQSGFEEGYLSTIQVTYDDSPLGCGPTGTAIKTRKPVFQRHIDTDPTYAPWREAALARGYHASAAFPLLARDQVLGALNVYSESPSAFGPEEVTTLETLASQAAIAIENARLYEEATHRVRELSTLYESSKAITQLLTADEFTQRVIQVMERLLDYEYGAILLIDEQTGELVPFALSDRGKGREFVERDKEYIRSRGVKVGLGITGWVAQTGQAVRVGDVRQDPRYLEVRPGIRSELCVPLQIGGRTIGVINIETAKPEAYTEHDERLLMTLAGQVAVAIENTRLYEDVKRAAAELEQKVKARTAELTAANEELRAANIAMLNLLEDLNVTKQELEERARLLEEAMQQAQEADRLKTAFLTTVSHELRTPLASIKGFATTLLADDVTWDAESQRDFIETIDQEADRLTELIGQLLEMSRLESGTLRIERERCHLADIVTRISERLEGLTVQHGLVLEMAPALPLLYVDPIRIGNVLTNLVENAAKFAPAGTKITIAAWAEDRHVIVSVADEGPGIAPDDQERLFERFYRVDNELTRSRPGTGLGLAICKGLVEAHGGRIWVESEPGQGATFFFSLPTAS